MSSVDCPNTQTSTRDSELVDARGCARTTSPTHQSRVGYRRAVKTVLGVQRLDAQRAGLLRTCRREARQYGTARTSPSSFLAHHLASISAAVVYADAQPQELCTAGKATSHGLTIGLAP